MYAASRTHTSVVGRQQVRDRLVAAERRFAPQDETDAPARAATEPAPARRPQPRPWPLV